jgi:nucleoside-diphosphate-sugar epimerase
MRKDTSLIIGANGQLGSVLTEKLQTIFGYDYVISSDIRQPAEEKSIFEYLDILDKKRLEAVVEKYQVTQIYHLAAILSASGEKNPLKTWDINMQGLLNVLELARVKKLSKVYFPSSIAVFGLETPRINTPQHTVLAPTTVYGMSKVAGENWCQYYCKRYGMDIRSLRYPGVIGYQSLPGGGTTDYAVDIFHKAILKESFVCFLEAETKLPMIYMDDVIRGTIELMDAPSSDISIRTSYNLSGVSFSPKEITEAIQKYIPSFKTSYSPDFRQAIAESWPDSIDDSQAKKDWGWKTMYDLEGMTEDMLFQLGKKYKPVLA